jgi:hypothetical protein
MSGRVSRSFAAKCTIFFLLTDVQESSSSSDQLISLLAAGRLAVKEVHGCPVKFVQLSINPFESHHAAFPSIKSLCYSERYNKLSLKHDKKVKALN